jgi:hypothetical protein
MGKVMWRETAASFFGYADDAREGFQVLEQS